MNYKYLNLDSINQLKVKNPNENNLKKYEKILNNLLGINSRADHAVFTKLNKMNQDLFLLIANEKNRNQIFEKPEFKIRLEKLSNLDIANLKNEFKEIQTAKELEELLLINKIKFSKVSIKELHRHPDKLDEFKKDILEKIIKEKASSLTKWKRYLKEVNDAYEQTNMWPLFVGTYFIKVKLPDKVIYAPLLLKEVEITIENNSIFLGARNSSVVVNEKLAFLLEQLNGTQIPELNNEIDESSFNDVISEFNDFLKNIISFESFIADGEFEELKVQDITNSDLIMSPGLVLLFAQPLGGTLRKATIDLINQGKMESIITVNPDDIFQNESRAINKLIINPTRIARICPTDPSQEKAIISALNNHIIIIGPPGTGKSQTIANILTNILANNKRALFISQKRVALEVVLDRMENLQYFTLQLVEHKKKSSANEKEVFYNFLKKYLKYIEINYRDESNVYHHLNSLVSNDQLNYWSSKENSTHILQKDIDDYCFLLNKMKNKFDSSFLKKCELIFGKFKWMNKFDQIEKLMKLHIRDMEQFAQALNVKPKFKFFKIKKYDNDFKNLYRANLNLLDFINRFELDEELIKLLKSRTNFSIFESIEAILPQHKDLVPDTNKFESNEIEILKSLISNSIDSLHELNYEYPRWLQKFKGRIDRSFTPPTKFIRIFKNQLKKMFNVIVSTPEALSSFVDFKKDLFDYVIFDESSQIFLEKALPYMAISKKVIIAGDDQQMQPSNWFGNRFDNDEENEEENIDSLLTYAIASGIPKQTLELNYRSDAASLTTFSSKEFYESQLKTLDTNKNIIKPIEIINVDGHWENQSNQIEALKMIELLKENLGKYKKIILLTLNAQQMKLIDELIALNEPELYNKLIDGAIVLKNLENIQGDEADLVIISIGYTKESALASTYVCRAGGRNALNVAITRAKTKMIVIKSIHSEQINIKNDNNQSLKTFKKWIEFLELNEHSQKTYSIQEDENNLQSVESMFEYDVHQWLKNQRLSKPIKIENQYPIGSYRIDIALLDQNTNKYLLGLEIDGYRYHSSATQKYNDLVRQNFIEAKGYKIIRIPELLWKTDKSKVLEMIKNNI